MEKTVKINEREKEMICCFISGWAKEGSLQLAGHLSYQDVCDFCDKLGMEYPSLLKEIEDGTYEKRIKEQLGLN
jgi:hypothetical protein